MNLNMLQALGATETEKPENSVSGTCNLISPTRPVFHVLHFSNTPCTIPLPDTNSTWTCPPKPIQFQPLDVQAGAVDAKCAAGGAAGQKPLVKSFTCMKIIQGSFWYLALVTNNFSDSLNNFFGKNNGEIEKKYTWKIVTCSSETNFYHPLIWFYKKILIRKRCQVVESENRLNNELASRGMTRNPSKSNCMIHITISYANN
jgi:hypothetical protein